MTKKWNDIERDLLHEKIRLLEQRNQALQKELKNMQRADRQYCSNATAMFVPANVEEKSQGKVWLPE